MQNWLIRFLLSLSLAFFFLQGRSDEGFVTSTHSIHFTQPSQIQESVVAIKMEAQNEKALNGKITLSHKKNHSVQKLLIADGDDDDDDNDDVDSSRKHTINNFFSSYLNSENSFYYTKNRPPFCHHFFLLSSGKYLLFCTLKI